MQIEIDKLPVMEEKMNQEWLVYLCAKYYVEQGFYVIPLRKNSKFLPKKDYNINYGNASNKLSTIEKWFHPLNGKFPGWNIGMATGKEGGIFAIDIDRHGDQDGFVELEKLMNELNPVDEFEYFKGPLQQTPSGGAHHIFHWQENASSSTSKIAPGIDTRGGTDKVCKGHIVVYPSIINGEQYKWSRGGEVQYIPKWVLDKLGISWSNKPFGKGLGNEAMSSDDLEQIIPKDQIQRMLDAINPDTLSYDEWLRVGQSINTQYPTDVGLEMWDVWSSKGERYKPNECRIRWNGFSPGGAVRVGSLLYYAKESGWEPKKGDITNNDVMEVVERLNRQFAIVVVGGKIKILREKDNIEDPVLGHYDLLDKDSFKTLMQNDKIAWVNDKGKTVMASVADIWLANDARRTFPNGMRLMPDRSGHVAGCYNTWNGFSVKPREGDCSLILNHIEEVICDGDTDLYNWILDWCADGVQDPANPKGTCIVMRGREGAGKGTLANTMGELFGSHYRHLIDDSHLLSNFNAHMIDALFVFADEITWGGNQKTSGKLKGMVTEKWLVGERKGVDAVGYRNMVHMMIASNSNWIIPAGTNSRRWCVVDVNHKYTGDPAYFNNIQYQLENGGREAFLHFLLNREITSNLRKAPSTKALEEQQSRSLVFDTVTLWWIDILSRGNFIVTSDIDPQNNGWPNVVITSEAYDEYCAFCKNHNHRIEHLTIFGKEMRKFGIKAIRPRINNDRPRALKIPTYDVCVKTIEDEFGLIINDEEDENE